MNALNELKKIAEKKLAKNDSAHDFEHVMRVYRNAEKICKSEKVDSKLVLTSVLLHDIVSFPNSGLTFNASSIARRLCCPSFIKSFEFMEMYNLPDFPFSPSAGAGENRIFPSTDAVSDEKT